LISLNEAQVYVLERAACLPALELDVDQALEHVVVSDTFASEAVPPFDNSAMDGFAVRSSDTLGAPVELTIVGSLAAGYAIEQDVQRGDAVRIMTGAPIPNGADAVVPVEQTHTIGGIVTIEKTVNSGTSIRRAGEDVSPGDVVVKSGTVLTPAHLGVLASVGIERITTFRRPRVGILTTGDELVRTGPLRPGQIRNSNGPVLRALVREAGFEVVDLGNSTDDEQSLTVAIERAVTVCDAVLTTGGVSVGDYDNVKVILNRIGEMRWMQIAIKPSKPFAFGLVHGIPIFGLPGNPVSSLISFELLARPALRKMSGRTDLYRMIVPAIATEGLANRTRGKTNFIRVVAGQEDDGTWSVRSAGGQNSHQLTSMAAANALAMVADGLDTSPGATVPTMLLRGG
jgi:molybdopterin molybdotransferase